jgi:hypothetical protein
VHAEKQSQRINDEVQTARSRRLRELKLETGHLPESLMMMMMTTTTTTVSLFYFHVLFKIKVASFPCRLLHIHFLFI